jgi:hypothetical protein
MLLRNTMRLLPLAAALALAAAPVHAAKAVVFPFELIDTSHEGEIRGARADETARLALITAELRSLLANNERYEPVDASSLAAEIASAAPLHKCNGCEADLAKKLGAELAIIGTVQKVSNLILNVNLYVRDVATGKPLRAMSVDIRGNTDDMWLRGVRWLVRNRLLADDAPR